MTTVSAQAVHAPHDATSLTKTAGGFVNYLTLLCEAYDEAMQQTYDTRRNYPFMDV